MKTKRRTVLDVLVAARELIKKGWTQGEFVTVNEHGASYCVLGALRKIACGTIYSTGEGYAEYVRAKEAIRPRGWFDISAWNDAPGRTKRQVLALFDEVIRKLEKQRAS